MGGATWWLQGDAAAIHRGYAGAAQSQSTPERNVDFPLRGRVVPDLALPSDESLEIVVESWSLPKGQVTKTDRIRAMNSTGREWKQMARVSTLPNGTFETPRPVGAALIRLRVLGDYVCDGSVEFEVGGNQDPGEGAIDIPVRVGAHVTLELDFEGVADAHQIAALAGEIMTFEARVQEGSGAAHDDLTHRAETTLGSDGRAVLRGLRPFDWSLHQDLGDSRHQSLAPFRAETGFRFRANPGERIRILVPMGRGKRLEGHVRDREGRPVPGARAMLARPMGGGPGAHIVRQVSRTTDKNGYFLFQALDEDMTVLTVAAQGFLPYAADHAEPAELASALETPGPRAIELRRSHSLMVQVMTADGRPAAGLAVRVTSRNGLEWKGPPTDSQGLSLLDGLAAEEHRIQAIGRLPQSLDEAQASAATFEPVHRRRGMPVQGFDPSKESLWMIAEEVPANAITGGDILRLQVAPLPMPMVRGRLVGAALGWAQPHEVFVYRRGWRLENARGVPETEGTFTVDLATGAFEGQLPPGSYVAEATAGRPTAGTAPKGSPQVRRSNAVPFEVAAEDVELRLDFGAALGLTGSVTLPDGAPVRGVDVLLDRQGSMSSSTVAVATTNGSGHFRFVGLGAGRYALRVRSLRYAADAIRTATIAEGSTNAPVELVVHEAGALRVEIVDARGDSIPDAELSVLRPDGFVATPCIIEAGDAWAGAYGPMIPGVYTPAWLDRRDRGAIRFHRAQVEVEAGKVAHVRVQVAAEPTTMFEGKVLSGGQPAPGVTVWLSDELGIAAVGKTDAEGQFRLETMTSGSMVFLAGASLFAPALERAMELVAGPSSAADIVLPTGSIECTFASDSGATLFDVPALNRAGATESGGPYRRSVSSFHGVHTIPYLPDGEYELFVTGRQSGRIDGWQPQTIVVKNGQRVRGVKITRIR